MGGTEYNKADKPFKNYILNKDGEKVSSADKTNKTSQSSTQNVPSSSNIDPSKSSTTINSSKKSVKTLPFVFKGDINELNDTNGRPSTLNGRPSTSNEETKEPYPSSSVYSQDLPLQSELHTRNNNLQDFYLYDDPSNFNTPSTMNPLFNNSNPNISMRDIPTLTDTHHYSGISSNNSLRPTSLNIPNRTEATQNSDTSSSLIRPASIIRPYDLSGNGVLPNVPFDNVSSVRENIPLNNGLFMNRNLPLISNNYENNDLNNIADTPRMDDPCSLQYQSRHNPSYIRYRMAFPRPHEENNYYNSNVTQEIDINKSGIKGRVKLVIKSIGSKFTNGINKVESAYIKYETVSKRHII